MKHRLLALTVALLAMTATAAPAHAGFGSSPGPRAASLDQELDHGRPAR